MKKQLAFSTALIMSTLSIVPAFADTIPQTALKPATVIITPEPVYHTLTLKEAVAMAIDNSNDLYSLNKQKDFLREQKEDLWDLNNGFVDTPSKTIKDYIWVDDYTYAMANASLSIEYGIEQIALQSELVELACEVSVRNLFSTIIQAQSNLELTKQMKILQEETYNQTLFRYNIGFASKSALDQAQMDITSTEFSIKQLEQQISYNFTSLNNVIGVPLDSVYELEKITEFDKFTTGAIHQDTFIYRALALDIGLSVSDLAVEQANINKYYIPLTITDSTMKQNDFDLSTAQRSYKELKLEKELLIIQAFAQLEQIEQLYYQGLHDLDVAKESLRVAQVNYRVGYITKLQLDQAVLGVMQAESSVQNTIYTYDLQKFLLNNTSLLS